MPPSGLVLPTGKSFVVFAFGAFFATKLLGHAITAKTSKIDKKLKAIDLDLKRRRLEMQEKQANLVDNDNEGSARELDRNQLLEILRNKSPNKDGN